MGGNGNVMVLAPGVIVKVRVCGMAATKDALPACETVIEHDPAATRVMAPVPSIVQVPTEFEA